MAAQLDAVFGYRILFYFIVLFYLWGSLKGKVYETNSHTMEEIRSKIPVRFQQLYIY
jgi:hypothetical protein